MRGVYSDAMMRVYHLFIIALALSGCAQTGSPTPAAATAPAPVAASSRAVWRLGFPSYWTARQLISVCGSVSAEEVPADCAAYIAGVSDGHNATAARGDRRPSYCLSIVDYSDKVAKVVRAYLAAQQENADRPAGDLVLSAFMTSYPCTKSAAHRVGYANYWSDLRLSQECGAGGPKPATTACGAYIIGVSDGHIATTGAYHVAAGYCLAPYESGQKSVDAVRGYFHDHSAPFGRSASGLVIRILGTALPCYGV